MRKGSPLRGAWRLIALCALVGGLFGSFPASFASAAAQASSILTITALDDLGAPLAGAEFVVLNVVEDPASESGLAPGEGIIAGPLATDATGTVVFADLPDHAFVAVVQTAIPIGYLPESFPERIVTTDPAEPLTLTYVNPLQSVVPGAVDVVVSDSATDEPLSDATVQVSRVRGDGSPGAVVDAATTGPDGSVVFSLAPGSYAISVVANPAGYADTVGTQIVTVEATGQETGDYDLVTIPLEAQQPEPTTTPSDPTATLPPEPTATVVPTNTPTPPPAPARVIVEKIVCTTGDAAQIGTVDYRIGTSIQLNGTALPAECRPAAPGEFSFVLVDPMDRSNNFDDVQIASNVTDQDGFVSFDVPLTEPTRTVFVYELEQPTPFSEPFEVTTGETATMLAINFVPVPLGDVVVRTADSVTGSTLFGECYALAAAGAEAAPVAEACDADDGTEDGIAVFGQVPNGTYSVMPTQTTPNYVPAGTTQVVVNSGAVDVTFSATPYGSLSVLAYACAARTEAAFAVTVGQPAGDGTDLGLSEEQAALTDGCAPADADVEIVLPSDSTAPFTVQVNADGVSAPVALRPTDDGTAYLVRDPASGASVEVAIEPAVRTIVTVALPGAVDESVGAAAVGGAPAGSVSGPTTDDGTAIRTTAPGPTSTIGDIAPNMTEADRAELRTVTVLPRTGAGVPGLETGDGQRWPIFAVLTLLTFALTMPTVAPLRPPRRRP